MYLDCAFVFVPCVCASCKFIMYPLVWYIVFITSFYSLLTSFVVSIVNVTLLYFTLPLRYGMLLYSTLPLRYIAPLCIAFTLLHSTLHSLHNNVRYSTLLYLCGTALCYTFTEITLLYFTVLYYTITSLYWTIPTLYCTALYLYKASQGPHITKHRLSSALQSITVALRHT